MNIISQMSKDFLNTFNKQNYNENYNYHISMYLKHLEIDCKNLIYNTLTGELILLSEEEYVAFIKGNLNETNFFLYHFLIQHWFLIPNEYNEKMMVYLYRNMRNEKSLINEKQNTYIILTTTDCNARCYYCFEFGAKRVNMSASTALDVADYILKKSDHDKPIHISWFGGEPLYNSKVIDIITSRLKEYGLKYESTMVSNGYLFDDDMIKKAKDKWRLRRVQITLDGTTDIYNKSKAYIYRDDLNPFDRVLMNIKKLSQANIQVHIRCNLSLENYLNLRELIDVVDEYFSEQEKKCIMMYFNVLYEMNAMKKRTSDEEKRIYNELYELEKYCISKKLYSKEQISLNKVNSIKTKHCMADSPNSVLISPEGNLGLCEHFVDSNFYGSIYDENTLERDYSILREWKKTKKEQSECANCCHYPTCYNINKCEVALTDYPFCYNKMDRRTERAIINTYEFYKKKKGDEDK